MKTVIVDAYNFILTLTDRETIDAHELWETVRQNLLQRMIRYYTNSTNRVYLVYDNKSNYSTLLYQAERRRSPGGVTVVFSQPPHEADDRIVTLVQELEGQEIVVVTNDERLGQRVRGLHAQVQNVYEFKQEEERAEDAARERFQRVGWLADKVLSEKGEARREKIEELATLGYPAEALRAYQELLTDASPEFRIHGVRGVMSALPEGHEDYVMKLLTDEHEEVLLMVVDVLLSSRRRDIRLALLQTARTCPFEDVSHTILTKCRIDADENLAEYMVRWYVQEEEAERVVLDGIISSIHPETLLVVCLEILQRGELRPRLVRDAVYRLLSDKIAAATLVWNVQDLPAAVQQQVNRRIRLLSEAELAVFRDELAKHGDPPAQVVAYLVSLCDIAPIREYVKVWKSLVTSGDNRLTLVMHLLAANDFSDPLYLLEHFPNLRPKSGELLVAGMVNLPLRVHEVNQALTMLARWSPAAVDRFLPVVLAWIEQHGVALESQQLSLVLALLSADGLTRLRTWLEQNRDLIAVELLLACYPNAPFELRLSLIDLAGLRQGRKELEFLQARLVEQEAEAYQAAQYLIRWADSTIIKNLRETVRTLPKADPERWNQLLATIPEVENLAALLSDSKNPTGLLTVAMESWASKEAIISAAIQAFPFLATSGREEILKILTQHADFFSDADWLEIQQWVTLTLPEAQQAQLTKLMMRNPDRLTTEERLRLLDDRKISWHDKERVRDSLFADARAYEILFGDYFAKATGKFRAWLLEGLPESVTADLLTAIMRFRERFPGALQDRLEQYLDDAPESVILEVFHRRLQDEKIDLGFWTEFWLFRFQSRIIENVGKVRQALDTCIERIRSSSPSRAMRCEIALLFDRFELARFERIMTTSFDDKTTLRWFYEVVFILRQRPFLSRITLREAPRIVFLILEKLQPFLTNFSEPLEPGSPDDLPLANSGLLAEIDKVSFQYLMSEVLEVVNSVGKALGEGWQKLEKDPELLGWINRAVDRLLACLEHPRTVRIGAYGLIESLLQHLTVILDAPDLRLRTGKLILARAMVIAQRNQQAYTLLEAMHTGGLADYWIDWAELLFRRNEFPECWTYYLKVGLPDRKSPEVVEQVLTERILTEASINYKVSAFIRGVFRIQTNRLRSGINDLTAVEILTKKPEWREWRELQWNDSVTNLEQLLANLRSLVDPSQRAVRDLTSAVIQWCSAVTTAAPEIARVAPELTMFRLVAEAGFGEPKGFLTTYLAQATSLDQAYHQLAGYLFVLESRFTEALDAYQRCLDDDLLQHLIEVGVTRLRRIESLTGVLLNLLERRGRTELPGYTILCVYRGLTTNSYRTYWDRVLLRWPVEYGAKYNEALTLIVSSGALDAKLAEIFSQILENRLRPEELEAALSVIAPRLKERGIKLQEHKIPMFLKQAEALAKEQPTLGPVLETIKRELIPQAILDREELRRFKEGKPVPAERVVDIVNRYEERGDDPKDMVKVLELLPTRHDPALRKVSKRLKQKLQIDDVRKLMEARNLSTSLLKLISLIGSEGDPDLEVVSLFRNPAGISALDLHTHFLNVWGSLPPDQPNLRTLLLIALANKAVNRDLRLRSVAQWLLNQVRDDPEIRAISMRLLFEAELYFEAYYSWVAIRQQRSDLLQGSREYSVVPLGVVKWYLQQHNYRKAWRYLKQIDLLRYLQTEPGQLLATFLEYKLAFQETDRPEQLNRLEEVSRKVARLAMNPTFKHVAAYFAWNITTLNTQNLGVIDILQGLHSLQAEERELNEQLRKLLKPDNYFGGDAQGIKLQREIEHLILTEGKPIEIAEEHLRREFGKTRPIKNTREGLQKKIEKLRLLDDERRSLDKRRKSTAAILGNPDFEINQTKQRLADLRHEHQAHSQNELIDIGFIYAMIIQELASAVKSKVGVEA